MFAPLEELVACAAAQVERAGGRGQAQYESFQERLAEKAAAVERSAHVATLSALDVDAPKILINGELHACRPARDDVHDAAWPRAGDALAVPSCRREERSCRRSGEPAGGRGRRRVDAGSRARHGVSASAGHLARGGGDGSRAGPACRIRARASSAWGTSSARSSSRNISTSKR